jgi:hypothetical protein
MSWQKAWLSRPNLSLSRSNLDGEPLVLIRTNTLGCHDAVGVVLKVEHVLHILCHLCPPGMELFPGNVAHSLEALPPLWLLLLEDWIQRNGRVFRVW